MKTLRILCAQADPGVLKSLQILLETCGHQVIPVSDAGTFLDALSTTAELDLAIIGEWLPDIRGSVLLEHVRMRKHFQELPVIVFSADTAVQPIAARYGAMYVEKDGSTERLMETIEEVCAAELPRDSQGA